MPPSSFAFLMLAESLFKQHEISNPMHLGVSACNLSLGVLLIALDLGVWLLVRQRKARPGVAYA
jgi:hypothetical protein